MSGFIEGVDRKQVTLFPDLLEDWIEEDYLVRVVVISSRRPPIEPTKCCRIHEWLVWRSCPAAS